MSRSDLRGNMTPLLALLTLVTFIGCALAYIFLVQYRHFRAYVSENPVEVPRLPQSPEARAAVLAKIRGFAEAGSPDSLRLNAREINLLMQASPALRELDYGYHVSLEDSFFVARASIPLRKLRNQLSFFVRLLGLEGYVNAEMKAYPRLQNGDIEIIPLSARMNGKEAPLLGIAKQGRVNPRELAADSAAYAALLRNLEGVRIVGGELLLTRTSQP